jgi:hypothetical protein
MKILKTAAAAATLFFWSTFAVADGQCPANSTPVASGNGTVTCRCNDGYVNSGGHCVPVTR